MANVDYLTSVLERTEQELSYYANEIPKATDKATQGILLDGYLAALSRHEKIIALQAYQQSLIQGS